MIDVEERALVETHGRALALGASISDVLWIGGRAWFACGDGHVRIVDEDAGGMAMAVHGGAILCAVADPGGEAILTGGDDGALVRTTADGVRAFLVEPGRKWVEHVVASAASGLIVAGIGKDALVWKRGSDAAAHRYGFASTVGGLALDAKGKRLAASHYGGATLIYANSADSGRVQLQWQGSHLGCTIAPGGDYIVTAMQEIGLHGWQLPGMMNMAMSGYRAKTRSFSWSRRGKWLATSGDLAVIIWPFDGKTGPMGKAPVTLARGDRLVTRVAFHPLHDMLAVGFGDGAVSLVRMDDDAYANVQAPGTDAITALAWDAQGETLAWGGEDGIGGLIELNRLPRK